MAVYETEHDRIVLRVVYDGPGLVGKTTNLEQLAQAFHGEFLPDPPDATPPTRGQPPANRTRFFDWFAFDGGKLDGHGLAIQVVSVPGHKRFEARRAALLRSADAIVLVCDSAPAAQESARETLDSQREHLGALASQIPLVVQANKQDLPNAMQPHELGVGLGLPLEVPVLAAQASGAIGVRETVVQAVRTAVRRIKRQITRGGIHSLNGTPGDAATLRAELERLASPALPEDGPKEPPRTRRRPAQRLTIVNEPRVVQMRVASAGKFGTRTPVSEPRDFPPRPEPERPRAPDDLSSRPALFFDEPPPQPPAQPPNTPPSERVTLPDGAVPTPTLLAEGELSPATLHALVEMATALPPARSPAQPAKSDDLSPGTASLPPSDPGLPKPGSRLPRRIPSAPEIPMVSADLSKKPARRPRTRPQLVVPAAPPITPANKLILPPAPRTAAKPGPEPADPVAPAKPLEATPTSPAPARPSEPMPTSPAPARPSEPIPTSPAPARPSEPIPTSPAPARPSEPTSTSRPAPATSASPSRPAAPTRAAEPHAAEPTGPLPPLPRPDIPTGHVWPVPRGREVLRLLVDLPVERLPAPPRQHGDPPLLLAAGDWRLCTRDAQRYASLEAAHAALLERVRHTRPCAALLARDLVLVVQPEGDAGRLWHIVPRLDGIREHLALRPAQARPRLLAALATAVTAVLRLWLRHGVALELDLGSFAVEAGRVVHIGDRIGTQQRDVGVALLGLCERLSGDAAALSAFTAALEQELAELTAEERARLELEAALVRAETRYQDAHVARNRLLAALRAPG